MTIYIVERESGGMEFETDCFLNWKLAKRWADVCGGQVREENTWDADFTKEMIQTYTEEG